MNIARQFEKPGAPAKSKKLDIELIRRDGGTQPRAGLDRAVAMDYSEDLAEGVVFPPVTVFYDGETYWLADGYHRVEAHILAGKKKVSVEVRQGHRRDAILHSVGANATHGLQRGRADKRRAVETLLADAEWSKWSDREIARRCNVSADLVGDIRSFLTVGTDSERTYKTKHGTTAVMDTSAIGSRRDNRPDETVSVEVDEASSNVSAPKSGSAKEPEPDHRQQITDGLSQEIKDREAAKEQAIAARKIDGAAQRDADRIAELEESVRVLEAEAETLRAENKLYGEMRVQFEQGGFDKVIAGKDNEIRALETRVYSESADKAAWIRASRYWKDQALKLGYVRNPTIDIDPVEVANG